MNRVRGIVFDLDGTLVDSYDAITASLNHARRRFDLPDLPEAEVRLHVGRGLEALIADLLGPEQVAEGVELFRRRYASVYLERTQVLPEVPGTLERLKSDGYRMAVASNKPARFTGPILERFGLLGLFDTVAGPDTAGSTKPDPSMIRACLAAMEVRSAEAVYVGDMVLDAESGRRAGVPVLLVDGGSSIPSDLRAAGGRVLERFSLLPRALKEPPREQPLARQETIE